MCRLTWQKVTGRAEMLIRSALLAPVSLARTALVSETRRVWKMRWQERVAEPGYCCPLQLVESGYCCPLQLAEQGASLIATAVGNGWDKLDYSFYPWSRQYPSRM